MKKAIIFLAVPCAAAIAIGACSSDNTNNGTGTDGGGSSSSSGSSSGSSSSSSSGSSSSGSSSSSSSSSSGGLTFNTSACTKTSDCAAAGAQDICCFTVSGSAVTSVCQLAPCMALPVIQIAVQLCGTTADCPSGEVCGPAPAAFVQFGAPSTLKFCLPGPMDGGGAEGGDSGGGQPDSASDGAGGEGGGGDSGGDSAPPSDAAEGG